MSDSRLFRTEFQFNFKFTQILINVNLNVTLQGALKMAD